MGLIQNILGIIPVILALVLILMVITNIIVEVLKGIMWDKLPTNMLALIVAMAVTLLAFFALSQIAGIPVTWYMVAGAVILGVFVAYAAMFGYDKLRQMLAQINSIKKSS